jgi:hypothetical protein
MIIIYPPETYPVPVRKIGNDITFSSQKTLRLYTESSSGNYTTTYTQYPVADGNIITDHARNEPVEITEEIILNDDPGKYMFAGEQEASDSEMFSFVLWEYLKKLKDNFVVLEVNNYEQYFPSMTITRLTTKRSPDTGNIISVSATFKEYQTVKSLETYNTNFENASEADTKRQGAGKKDTGKNQKNAVDETSKKGVDRTVLDTLYNAVL